MCRRFQFQAGWVLAGWMLAAVSGWAAEPAPSEDVNDLAFRLRRSAGSLDEILDPKERVILRIERGRKTEVKVKPLDRSALVPVLSYILNMDRDLLEKSFIEQKLDLSDIIFARHISAKKRVPFESVVKAKEFDEWLADLKREEIPLKDVVESLDHVYMEVSFRALDERMK